MDSDEHCFANSVQTTSYMALARLVRYGGTSSALVARSNFRIHVAADSCATGPRAHFVIRSTGSTYHPGRDYMGRLSISDAIRLGLEFGESPNLILHVLRDILGYYNKRKVGRYTQYM